MAIYYKDFNGKVRIVVAGKAPFPVADSSTVGGVKVTGGPGESAPYKVMSEGAVDSKLFDYAKKDHTHLMKEVYKLDESLDSKAPIDHIHDDRYYTESEVDWAVNQINERIGQVDDKLAGKADAGHIHSDYLTISQAGQVYQPKSAMTLYATKEDLEKMGGSSLIYKLAEFDTTAGPECLQALKNKKNMKEVVEDLLAWTAVLQSSSAIKKVIESTEAMQAVANNNQAMTSVEKSLFLMNEVARSPWAMLAIANSPIAIKIITSSSRCGYVRETQKKGGNLLPIRAKGRGYANCKNGESIALTDKNFEYVLKNPRLTIANQLGGYYSDDYVFYYNLDA